MTNQNEQTTNGEAMTPQQQVSTTDIVADLTRVLVEHGLRQEASVRSMAEALQHKHFELRMAHKAMDEGDRRIGELQDQNGNLRELLADGFALLGKGFCFGNGQITSEWQSRVQAWADRFNEAGLFATYWNLTDEHKLPPVHVDDEEDPSDADVEALPQNKCGPGCEHCPDGGLHPIAPSAG